MCMGMTSDKGDERGWRLCGDDRLPRREIAALVLTSAPAGKESFQLVGNRLLLAADVVEDNLM